MTYVEYVGVSRVPALDGGGSLGKEPTAGNGQGMSLVSGPASVKEFGKSSRLELVRRHGLARKVAARIPSTRERSEATRRALEELDTIFQDPEEY